MSILIKGVEMPETCSSCPCYRHIRYVTYEEYDLCRATMTSFNDGYASALRSNKFINPFEKRLDNCSCIEVPTPYGRLIDADAAVKLMQKYYDCQWDPVKQYAIGQCIAIINETPTIIEAEGE